MCVRERSSNVKKVRTVKFISAELLNSRNFLVICIVNKRPKMNIFLSYPWAHKHEADIIDKFLLENNVNVIRDIRDLPPLGHIKSFMERIREADFAVLLISDSYLTSKNCLYEVVKLLEDNTFKTKAIPILLEDAKVTSPVNRLDYLKFWEIQEADLEQRIKSEPVRLTDSSNILKELEEYRLVRKGLNNFFNFLTEYIYFSYSSLVATNFSLLANHLQLKKCEDNNLPATKSNLHQVKEEIKSKPNQTDSKASEEIQMTLLLKDASEKQPVNQLKNFDYIDSVANIGVTDNEQRRRASERLIKLLSPSLSALETKNTSQELSNIPAYVRRNLKQFDKTFTSVTKYYDRLNRNGQHENAI